MSPAATASRSARTSHSFSGRRAATAKRRLGSVTPRLWTKPLRKLTPKTSLGYEAIEFGDWIFGRIEEIAAAEDRPELLDLVPRLLEWQRWLLIHALELLPGPKMVFRFRTVLLLVSRQNGKTVIMIYLILWRLFHDGAKRVVGTAQSIVIAEEAWDTIAAIADAIPELSDEVRKINRGKSDQAIVLETRARYSIAAANRRGGRGTSGDLVVMDELREHQSWDSWSAVSKTTLARERGQVWGISNAGDVMSIVLRYLRDVALAATGEYPDELSPSARTSATGDDLKIDETSVAIFEWSAPNDAPTNDRAAWAMANPSMGYTGLSEATIAAAYTTDPDPIFRTEVMCQFVNTVGAGPFPNGSWAATNVLTVDRDTDRVGVYCLDVSEDRLMAHIAIAYWDTLGRKRVEIAASRAGTDWVVPWFTSPARKIEPEFVTLQTRGAPATSMITDMENAGIELTEWGGADLGAASGIFFDAMRLAVDDEDPRVTMTHGVQPNLDVAATSAAIKALGDGWAIDRKKSPGDASPLVAAMGAIWLLNTDPEPERSAYEDSDVLVL